MICFIFYVILRTAYTADACALTNVLPSLSFIDMIYFSMDTKRQCVVVDFYVDLDFSSPQRLKRFRDGTARLRCVFGSTDDDGL